MNTQEFKTQMQRLTETYGANAYPEPVTKLFWRAFQGVSVEVFSDALDDLIANCRAKPMLKEITAAVDESRERQKEALYSAPRLGMGHVDPMGPLLRVPPDAENEPERKEWHLQRKSLLQSYLERKITREHFRQGCDYLDEALRLMAAKKGPCHACNGDGFVALYKHGLHRCFCDMGRAQYPTLKYKPSRGDLEDIPIPRLDGVTQWEIMTKA